MSEEELKDWFWDKFNNCYAVKHEYFPYSIFWYYNKSFVRKLKLNKINNEVITLNKKVNDICIFEQNFKNNQFNCDFDEIWKFFDENYSTRYIEIQSLITGWLKVSDKFSISTPTINFGFLSKVLKYSDKLSVLSPK